MKTPGQKIDEAAHMSKMGELVKFLIACWQERVFHENPERTPEELMDVLMARSDATERVRMFLSHATKTAFANLTAVEMLAGKIKAKKLENRGEDYLMDRTAAEPLDKRVACVISEGKYWDWSLTQIS
jgi:hypothetical protein